MPKWFLNEDYFIDLNLSKIYNIKTNKIEILNFNLNTNDFIYFNDKKLAYETFILYLFHL